MKSDIVDGQTLQTFRLVPGAELIEEAEPCVNAPILPFCETEMPEKPFDESFKSWVRFYADHQVAVDKMLIDLEEGFRQHWGKLTGTASFGSVEWTSDTSFAVELKLVLIVGDSTRSPVVKLRFSYQAGEWKIRNPIAGGDVGYYPATGEGLAGLLQHVSRHNPMALVAQEVVRF